MVRILLLNLLDDSLHFLSFAIIDSQVVLIVLECGTHAIESLCNLALLVSNEGLCEQAFGAGVVVATEFLTEPVQNDCKVLLSFVVKDEGDLDLVVLGNGEIVFNDEVSPDLDNLLEKSFRVVQLTRLLEELAHVEVARTHVDALRTELNTLLVDSACKFI